MREKERKKEREKERKKRERDSALVCSASQNPDGLTWVFSSKSNNQMKGGKKRKKKDLSKQNQNCERNSVHK